MDDSVRSRTPGEELDELIFRAPDDPIHRLIDGRDELSRWSEDVARAFLAFVAFLKEWNERADRPRRGRPLQAWLEVLVRVEMVRDLFERLLPRFRRLTRAEVLGVLYVGTLHAHEKGTEQKKTAERIMALAEHLAEGDSRKLPRALVTVIRRVDRNRFAALESKLSQALTEFGQDEVTIARFRSRRNVKGPQRKRVRQQCSLLSEPTERIER